MAVVGVAWAQTTYTIGWGTASGDAGTFTNFTETSGEVPGVLSFTTAKNDAGSAPAYNANNSELRLYYGGGNGGSITITPADGITITDAVITTSTLPAVAYYVDGGSATSVTGSSNTYTISNISASSSLEIKNVNTNTNTQLRIKTIAITYTTSGSVPPSISAADVSINADATEGEIVYTLANAVEGGSMGASTTSDWLTLGTNFDSPISFTCNANDGAERTATVTLTYSYGDDQTVTKDVTVTQAEYIQTVSGYSIDFESVASAYTDWTFANMESQQTGNSNVTAHGGTYYGTTGGKASASITTKAIIATPNTLTCYVTKQSNNTTASNWKIEVSSDGAEWTTVKEQSATSMTAGTWVELTASLTNYTEVYVRVSYSGSTAVRNIDDLTLVTEISTSPLINAENPAELTYDATSGEIAYTITNPVPGTLLQATADADWVSDITVGDEAITFTTTANELKTERVATFTLTYEGAEDKTVTVTQAGNPNIIDKIENISESGVPYNVQGTVVATSARAFVIGDGTGYIYYYNGNTAPSVSVGDMVKISGTTGNYGNVIQFTNAATITEATESEYTPLTPAAMTEVPDYTSGLYKSDYYQFEGMLTKEGNYYVVAVGEGQIRISYPSPDQTTELDALLNNTVKVKGFFAGNSTYNNNTIFTAIMESIEEVVSDEPSITLASYEVEVNANAHTTPTTIAVTYANIDFENHVPEVVFYESDGSTETTYDWLFVDLDADWNVYYIIEENTNNAARTAYFKVLGYDSNGNNVYSNLASITQAAAPAVAHCYYSVNGVVGTEQEATVGTPVTLEAGEDLDANFTFAGWTTDPNNVETLYTQYTFNANDVVTFYAVYAHTNSGATQSEASYVKVTSTDEIVDGNYLIVYEGEESNVAFDGGLETLDATENSIAVEITNGQIASSTEVMAAAFTIAAKDEGYSIKSASGLYIGNTSDGNNLKTSSNDDYTNIISIDNDGNANIVSSGSYLRYNSASNQLRFRYYKSASYTGQKAIQLYKYTEPTQDYYTRVFLDETVADDITIVGPSIIPAGQTLDMGENYILENNLGADRLIIEDGGQLKISNSVNGTVLKIITGYSSYTGTGNGGYYLIATPATLDATGETNMFPSAESDHQYVDFYGFDQTMVAQEWRNYKYGNESFSGPLGMKQGKGYLYASKNDVTLTLKTIGLGGYNNNQYYYTDYPFVPTNVNKTVEVSYNAEGIDQQEVVFKGYNLIGNPFTCKAYLADGRDFYRMNEAGDKIVVATDKAINVAEGIFVIVESGEKNVTFTTTDPTVTSTGGVLNITLSQAQSNRGNAATIDAARIRFGEGRMLPKFNFMGNNGGISIPQGSKDYAVVRSQGEGELPVNFKADKNGAYTLSIRPENVEMDYLHLIDNLTGTEVDLLATPTYTFNAKKTDYASRFRLVFSTTGVEENGTETNANFAYFNGSEWVVNASDNATLEVIDMMGRTVLCKDVARNVSTNGWAQGVYVLRLVDGNSVKTQKIVVR